MKNLSFYKFKLPLKNNLFNELSNSVDFEDVGKGREGNHLVNANEKEIPIVRTTTKYNQPAHNFSAIHHSLIDSIKDVVNNSNEAEFPSLSFNNALIEIYDHSYHKMKYHSDQCLDLDTDSYIALFSCYERPDDLTENDLRKLKVKNKTTDEEFEFSLGNNSVILFSLATNTKFMHKIVLDSISNKQRLESDNRWLGVTFRKSKTFIKFKNDLPYFSNGTSLKLADETQQKEFYQLRGQENKNIDFVYPELTYTLSISDTMMPKGTD